jgi:hypothetical protein
MNADQSLLVSLIAEFLEANNKFLPSTAKALQKDIKKVHIHHHISLNAINLK